MKNYYIRYPCNFANEYDLVWIDATDTESISTKRTPQRMQSSSADNKIKRKIKNDLHRITPSAD